MLGGRFFRNVDEMLNFVIWLFMIHQTLNIGTSPHTSRVNFRRPTRFWRLFFVLETPKHENEVWFVVASCTSTSTKKYKTLAFCNETLRLRNRVLWNHRLWTHQSCTQLSLFYFVTRLQTVFSKSTSSLRCHEWTTKRACFFLVCCSCETGMVRCELFGN